MLANIKKQTWGLKNFLEKIQNLNIIEIKNLFKFNGNKK